MKYFILLLSLISFNSLAGSYLPLQLMSAGDMSTAAAGTSITSTGVDLQQIPLASVQFVWTGAPVGFLMIQRSNDIVAASQGSDPAANVVNWTSDFTTSVASATYVIEKSYLLNIANAGFRWVRVKYMKVSGTGSLGVRFLGKNSGY